MWETGVKLGVDDTRGVAWGGWACVRVSVAEARQTALWIFSTQSIISRLASKRQQYNFIIYLPQVQQ